MKQFILDRCTDPSNPTLDEVPNEKIPVYDDNDAAEADLANLEVGQIVATKQVYDYTVFDINYPIGVTYTQYPQQKSPNELWGDISTWEELDYSGAFFRSSGGCANGFATDEDTLSNCLQAQATAKNGLEVCSAASGGTACKTSSDGTHCHLGGIAVSNTNAGDVMYGYESNSATGAVAAFTATYYKYRAKTSCTGSHSHSVYLSSTNAETRPVNYTVKIWVRTA